MTVVGRRGGGGGWGRGRRERESGQNESVAGFSKRNVLAMAPAPDLKVLPHVAIDFPASRHLPLLLRPSLSPPLPVVNVTPSLTVILPSSPSPPDLTPAP